MVADHQGRQYQRAVTARERSRRVARQAVVRGVRKCPPENCPFG